MDKQQTFWEHLEELRSRLIKALVGLFLASLAAYAFWERIWAILVHPLRKERLGVDLIAISPMETLMVSVKLSVIAGFILSFPWVAWQTWRFVAPAFFAKERKLFLAAFYASVLMFAGGALFCYLVVLPAGLAFLATYSEGAITQNWKLGDYASFTGQFLLAFGVIFELPVAAYVLTRMGLITPGGMRSFFRYAVIIIFIVAAVLTPGPDPVSQLLMAIPLCILYLVSIGVSALAGRQYERQMQETPA